MCRYVPDAANGGPAGADQPYWKTQQPGQSGWDRYNLNGDPITPEDAHPGQGASPEGGLGPIPTWLLRAGVFIGGMTYSEPAY